MIKTLVLEDEKPIARSIKRAIESLNENFEVVYIANNGRQALEYIKSEKIDVAFIDINVPVISGIDVLKYIHEEKLEIIPVILSGYQEFSYAQKAISLGVHEYLIKPIDKDKMQDTLNNIYLKLCNKKMRSQIFSTAETANPKGIIGEYCYFGFYSIGVAVEEYSDNVKVNDIILQKKTINALLQNAFNKENLFMAGGKEINEEFVFFHNCEQSPCDKMREIFDSNNFDIPITMFLSNKPVKLSSVSEVFYRNRHNFMSCSYLHKSKLVIGENFSVKRLELSPLLKEIAQILPSSNKQHVESILGSIFSQDMLTREDTAYLAKTFFFKICEKVSVEVNFLDIEPEICYAVDSAYSKEELINGLSQILNTYFYWYINDADSPVQLAKGLKQHIECNFEKNLSNSELEQKFGYSCFYLRKVFKESYGILPSAYLNNLRIEKAKELLLLNVQVKEVSSQLGYQDPLYFSKVFKKAVGVSPVKFAGEGATN